MIEIQVKGKSNLDKALKQLKSKTIQTGLMQEIKDRREYKKPSTKRRETKLSAIYRRKKSEEL